MSGSSLSSSQVNQSKRHRVKYIHPMILAHPGLPFRRQSRSEFFREFLRDRFSDVVLCSLPKRKKALPHLKRREQRDAHFLTGGFSDLLAQYSYPGRASGALG